MPRYEVEIVIKGHMVASTFLEAHNILVNMKPSWNNEHHGQELQHSFTKVQSIRELDKDMK